MNPIWAVALLWVVVWTIALVPEWRDAARRKRR